MRKTSASISSGVFSAIFCRRAIFRGMGAARISGRAATSRASASCGTGASFPDLNGGAGTSSFCRKDFSGFNRLFRAATTASSA